MIKEHASIRSCARVPALRRLYRPTEVRGVYVNDDSSGTLFPCDDPKIAIAVPDSALTARYRATVVAKKPVFVRLRGMSWAI